jgi:hypothetical protein
MAKPLTEAEKKVRQYLAEIGHRGGVMSRRELTRQQAKKMVAIREAKRAAINSGKVSSTLERWPLMVPPKKRAPFRQHPQIRPPRPFGSVLP